jgi:hypothetical protein
MGTGFAPMPGVQRHPLHTPPTTPAKPRASPAADHHARAPPDRARQQLSLACVPLAGLVATLKLPAAARYI